MADKLVTDTQ